MIDDSTMQLFPDKGDTGTTIFVPMHVNNWVLSLASGYVGGKLGADTSSDVQSIHPEGILAFDKAPPRWAIEWGEAKGDRVILKMDVPGDRITEHEGFMLIDGFIHVNSVELVQFRSKEASNNFFASFSVFPDIPYDLLPTAIYSEDGEVTPPPDFEGIRGKSVAPSVAWDQLDLCAGWAAFLVSLLIDGSSDDLVASQFMSLEGSETGDGFGKYASRALKAVDPGATPQDQLIWAATAEMVLDLRGARGFDRRELIERLERKFSMATEMAKAERSAIEKWLSVAKDIVAAKRDFPPLDDGGAIGQRAALALIVAHEPQALSELSAGKIVKSLVGLVSAGFQGFKRMDAKEAKTSLELVGATLSMGEALAGLSERDLSFSLRKLNHQFEMSDVVCLNGTELMQRSFGSPPYLPMLQVRAKEEGYQFLVEDDAGLLSMSHPETPEFRIYVEEDVASDARNPVFRLWTPLIALKIRSPSYQNLRKLMVTGWKTGCAVGTRDFKGVDHICAFASHATNSLDRAEFLFHVQRIGHMVNEAGTVSKKARKVVGRN
jgi:hypothetical protein